MNDRIKILKKKNLIKDNSPGEAKDGFVLKIFIFVNNSLPYIFRK